VEGPLPNPPEPPLDVLAINVVLDNSRKACGGVFVGDESREPVAEVEQAPRLFDAIGVVEVDPAANGPAGELAATDMNASLESVREQVGHRRLARRLSASDEPHRSGHADSMIAPLPNGSESCTPGIQEYVAPVPLFAPWSVPRARSTPFFRSMVERGDMVVVHEPFSDLAGLGETDVEGRTFYSLSASTGFAPRERRYTHTVESSDELARFAAHHLPFSEQLHAQRLHVAA